jgi:hypothetical protein
LSALDFLWLASAHEQESRLMKAAPDVRKPAKKKAEPVKEADGQTRKQRARRRGRNPQKA